MSISSAELTLLLRAWSRGEEDAEEALWPVLYRELLRLARMVLRGRRRPSGPQTTTLVHEACPRRLHRTQPIWQGDPLAGRTLLLCEEQGAGDMIQFVRLASRVRELGGRVLVECGRPLRRLFETVPGVEGCVAPDVDCPDAHYQLPLLSLPRVLGLCCAWISRAPRWRRSAACPRPWRAAVS